MTQSLLLLKTALVSLRRNIMRSMLTMLGIIIGICAVVIMVALGQGAQQQVEGQIASLGSNTLMVRSGAGFGPGGARGAAGSKVSITESDVAALKTEIPEIEAASGSTSGRAQVVVDNLNWNTQIQGIQADHMLTNNWTISLGRAITEADNKSTAKVALLGETLVEELFYGDDPIGQSIRINNVPLEVIGVLAAKGESTRGDDQDDVIMLPLSTAKKRVLGVNAKDRNKVSSVAVKVTHAEDMDWVTEEIERVLNQRHRVPSDQTQFSVHNLSEFMAARAATNQVFNSLLAGVAAVSLLVGGIGVMNIMLVSVTERTREIGLRMAVGARPSDILSQFLVEAVVLCMLGGLLGVGLSIGALTAMSVFFGWAVFLAPEVVLVSILVTSVLGIFFGYYPAQKAARLDPIDALRYE